MKKTDDKAQAFAHYGREDFHTFALHLRSSTNSWYSCKAKGKWRERVDTKWHWCLTGHSIAGKGTKTCTYEVMFASEGWTTSLWSGFKTKKAAKDDAIKFAKKYRLSVQGITKVAKK